MTLQELNAEVVKLRPFSVHNDYVNNHDAMAELCEEIRAADVWFAIQAVSDGYRVTKEFDKIFTASRMTIAVMGLWYYWKTGRVAQFDSRIVEGAK